MVRSAANGSERDLSPKVRDEVVLPLVHPRSSLTRVPPLLHAHALAHAPHVRVEGVAVVDRPLRAAAGEVGVAFRFVLNHPSSSRAPHRAAALLAHGPRVNALKESCLHRMRRS